MTRKRLCIGAVKYALMYAALFVVFFSVFSSIQVLMEYDYQYTDTVNKLEGLEERQNKSVDRLNDKLSVYLERRQKELELLLNENAQAQENLEAYKKLFS